MDPQKEKIIRFLEAQSHGVISTIAKDSQQPEAAFVGFSETPELCIIIGTSNESRKCHNIRSNPNVAFVVGSDDMTVQIEGVAEIADGAQVAEWRSNHLAKDARTNKYAFNDDQRYIRITPRWIRYTDGTVSPDDVFEITL